MPTEPPPELIEHMRRMHELDERELAERLAARREIRRFEAVLCSCPVVPMFLTGRKSGIDATGNCIVHTAYLYDHHTGTVI
jgi:hypothetical protein